MANAIELVSKDRLNDVGGGEFTATVGARPDLRRDTGQASQVGDVLSVQPDGALQTRPAGAAGNFERCVVSGGGLVYRPLGVAGNTFFVALALDWPNK